MTGYDADDEATHGLDVIEAGPSHAIRHSTHPDTPCNRTRPTKHKRQASVMQQGNDTGAKRTKGKEPIARHRANGPSQMTGPALNSRSSSGPSNGAFELPSWYEFDA